MINQIVLSVFFADRSEKQSFKSLICNAIFCRPGQSGVVLAVLATLFLAAPANTASAQGFFDLFRPSAPAPSNQALGDASPDNRAPAPQQSVSTGFSHCVRLCDGRHFPIQHHANASPAQMCNALCPAAETKVFSGSEIGRAVARDGTRYTSLENAFAYRTRIVSSCTCNGKDSFGTATIDASADPTLRKGDIVATTDTQVTPTAPNPK
jgi:hypothetical protein